MTCYMWNVYDMLTWDMLWHASCDMLWYPTCDMLCYMWHVMTCDQLMCWCQGAILVYDITSAKSLERLDTWHKELDKYDSEEGMVSHNQPISGLWQMRRRKLARVKVKLLWWWVVAFWIKLRLDLFKFWLELDIDPISRWGWWWALRWIRWAGDRWHQRREPPGQLTGICCSWVSSRSHHGVLEL